MNRRSPLALVATVIAVAILAAAPATATGEARPDGPEATTSLVSLGSMTGLDTGFLHTCGISEKEAYCWGRNSSGELGLGAASNTPSSTPAAVAVSGTVLDGKAIAQVVTGYTHTCARSTDGVIACWGDNANGQLGDGTTVDRAAPTAVDVGGTLLDGADITELVAGVNHTCALTDGGKAACWGYGPAVGYGSGADALVPNQVVSDGTPLDGKSIAQLSAGGFNTCTLANDATLACWGQRSNGQIGDGTTGLPVTLPTAPTIAGTALDGKTIDQIGVGRFSVCTLATDGSLACWGKNTQGQLGDGTTTQRTTAVAVTTAGTPLATSAPTTLVNGMEQHCAILANGSMACWGDNDHGQLGDGTTTQRTTPVAVVTAGTSLAGTSIEEMTSGDGHTCAAAGDAQPACWGWNFAGELGRGSTATRPLPAAVALDPKVPGPATGASAVVSGSGALVTISWSPPAVDGGADVTSYLVRVYEAGTATVETFGSPASSPITFELPAGTYEATVAAVNVAGAGAESARTAPFAIVDPPPQLPPGALYVPMTPCRILDTRQAGGTLADREIRDISVADDGRVAAQGGKAGGCDLPGDAIGIEASVAAVDPADSGFFRAWPAGESMPNATFMNFDTGMDITNTGSIAIAPLEVMDNGAATNAAGDQLRIRNFGGRSHYVIDLQGYYALPSAGPVDQGVEAAAVDLEEAAIYLPITPCRILDTRQAGGTLADREIRDISVADDARVVAQGGKAGGCELPAEAMAIEASIAAVDPADSGFFRAWPAGESMPNATFMNFDRGMDITNTGSIAIAPLEAMANHATTNAAGDQLRIRNFGGASHYVIDVQGVWVPVAKPPAPPNGAAASAVTEAPALYQPMTPCRILDTRQAGGTLADREIRDISFTDDVRVSAQGGKAGGCEVPIGTVAVEASITAVDPADSGFFRAWPAGTSMPNATFMNFDRGMDITNTGSITIAFDDEILSGAVASAAGDELRIRSFGGRSHYVIDIQGFYNGVRPAPSD